MTSLPPINLARALIGPASVLRPVATEGACQDQNLMNAGTYSQATYRYQHLSVNDTITGLRLVYCNFSGSNGAEVLPGNPIIVQASVAIGTVGATRLPVFFNGGQQTATIQPGGFVVSDPIGADIAPQTTIWSFTGVSVADLSKTWPLGAALQTSRSGSALGQNDVMSGAVGTNWSYGYGPAALIGSSAAAAPACLGVGDSIMSGQGPNWWGYWQVVTDALALGNVRTSIPGLFAANVGAAGWLTSRLALLAALKFDMAFVHIGTNDLAGAQSAATVLANLNKIVAMLQRRGVPRIAMATVMPRTTGSDGQTPAAGFGAGSAAQTVNAAIRAGLAGVNLVIDFSDAVSVSRDSWTWQAGYSVDGIHPSSAGTTPLATAFTAGMQKLMAM